MSYQNLDARDSAPATGCAAVTPSDSTPLAGGVTRFLWIGGAGNISLIFADSTTAVLNGATAGSLLPCRVTQVKATGTTATNIVALY